jgi:predicted glycosyltransferase
VNRHEPRLMIYSQDGLGLGHMRRTSLLAQEFLDRTPDGSVLTVSDSPLGQFFATAAGHDFLKLPSIRKTGPGVWEPVSLSLAFDEVLRLRTQLIASAIESFDPQVVLVDHMPHGAMGELVPALRAVSGRTMRVVLGLRDILDASDVVRRRWTAEGAYETLEEFYDEVLVYGQQDVLDVATEYAWPTSISRRLTYTGYVCADPPRRVSPNGSGPWQGGRTPKVLVVAGGGADAYPMFSAVLDAADAVHASTGAQFLMVTGPFMPDDHVRTLRRRAARLPMVELRRKFHGRNKIARADLVVSMAGYNTTVEVLAAGTPALLIPRSGPSAEQRTRAELFADRSWVSWLDPSDLHADIVAEGIRAGLQETLTPVSRPELTGRETAVTFLTQDFAPVARSLTAAMR